MFFFLLDSDKMKIVSQLELVSSSSRHWGKPDIFPGKLICVILTGKLSLSQITAFEAVKQNVE